MDNVYVGIIGLGAIAETGHICHLHDSESVTIAAVVDLDINRAESIAEKYQIPHYFKEAETMFKQVTIDAVIICTPNQTHIPIAKLAVDQGIHVLMEKPIGTDLQDVNDYLELAKAKKVLTMVGMTHRFRHDTGILKKFAEQKAFGDIYYAKAKLFRRRGTPKGWFTNKALSGGGAMMDIGVHVLDLAWWLLGNPQVQSITGKTLNVLGNYQTKYTSSWESKNKQLNAEHVFDVEDFSSAWIRFKNGSVLSLEIAWAVNGEQDGNIDIELFGNKGGATLSPLTIFKEEDGLLSKTTPLYEKTEPFKAEIEHFIECVRTNTTPLIDGSDGYEVLKMIHGIYDSSTQNKEVSFD
ncbi:Gfo/Idh/MocA family protein [Sediminibacillus albus]|uniref:Predicted dehydrogenase n=1 Tax=Sediminibacillus albus TaxID=407036 RepID=A0A1G8Y913_9BACI|nr:Gfo/Idh/MocA family oxidoreductase [Sediminibacillus albus]SDJ98904.1 Predicted dehydrogenase [Sediminibacillus albus]